MIGLILDIITFGGRQIYIKTAQYSKIVEEFKEKLPRPQKRARPVTKNSPSTNPVLNIIAENAPFTLLDVGQQKISISETDLDKFYNQINNFDYSFVLFKRYYQDYTKNLNRFNPEATDRNFDITFLQNVLYMSGYPLKPYSVFLYHLKYKWKLSSKIHRVFILRRVK